ncbi:unnamed protein product, partial [Rotaria sp. Silwood1]
SRIYTGTVKTLLTFSIPIVELLKNDTSIKLIRGRSPPILILAATRELTGRLKDIVDKGKVDLTKIKHVILDKVDRMVDMGFIDDVEEILEHIFTPNRETKPQFIVFCSATMPDWVCKATKKYMPKYFIVVDLVKGNTQ